MQHSGGQIGKTIERSRRKERREKRGGKHEKRRDKLCRCVVEGLGFEGGLRRKLSFDGSSKEASSEICVFDVLSKLRFPEAVILKYCLL